MIPFNRPPVIGTEIQYIQEAINNGKICGDGPFTKRSSSWLKETFSIQKCLLTTSGTAALEMAALLCNIQPGDEVILPSYTFSSTATAFVLAGAKLVFVDIEPNTMNIDCNAIASAITKRTKAICAVHYAGVSCDMDTIYEIVHGKDIKVVEDAAQGVMSTYKGKALGTLGDFGCYSFHETKNYSMGEGGALCIKSKAFNEKAEILREKGTNRSQFFRGQVAKYNWVDYGSSYLPSELNVAYLWGQLEEAERINNRRLAIWNLYYDAFSNLEEKELIKRPFIPEECKHNAHMFYIKCPNLDIRTKYIEYMKEQGISCCFHYVPLHSAPAGLKYGIFYGEDIYTTKESDRLVRLPLFYNMSDDEIVRVIDATQAFFACI